MKQYERFAECVRRILDEQDISVSELAKAVGFKSRNSLFRILNDQTSHEVEAAFFQTLKEKQCLTLSSETWAQLEEALEISRVGYSSYASNQAIRNLLITPQALNQTVLYCNVGGSGERDIPLQQLIAEHTSSKKLELLIFSCCSAPFCNALAEELRKVDLAATDLSVTHYLFAGEHEIVANVMAIQSLLYTQWYKAYMLEPNTCPSETEALLRVGLMIIHSVDQQGKGRWETLLMSTKTHMTRIAMGDDSIIRFMKSLITDEQPARHLVKSEFNHLCHTVDDYLDYTENLRLLERNCAVMSLKPDIPINYIHPDVLIAPIMEGLEQMGASETDDVAVLIKKLYDIQLSRFENFVNKKKVTHTVFSRKAMERFVQTGRQSDHFFAMRPYTPAERKQILVTLRDLAVNNPYFWVYFLNDQVAEHPAEITLYEGRGVMFVQADTGYNLEEAHNEALINNADLNEKLKTFFMKDLLANYVLSYQDNIALLDELIQMIDA